MHTAVALPRADVASLQTVLQHVSRPFFLQGYNSRDYFHRQPWISWRPHLVLNPLSTCLSPLRYGAWWEKWYVRCGISFGRLNCFHLPCAPCWWCNSDTKSGYHPRSNYYVSYFSWCFLSILTSQIRLQLDRRSYCPIASKSFTDEPPEYPRVWGFARGIWGQ
jgi:hypothetical protein